MYVVIYLMHIQRFQTKSPQVTQKDEQTAESYKVSFVWHGHSQQAICKEQLGSQRVLPSFA